MTTWSYATIPAAGTSRPMPVRDDPRDAPLEFDLTPAERAQAAQAQQDIERRRRHLNRHDDARAAGLALERLA